MKAIALALLLGLALAGCSPGAKPKVAAPRPSARPTAAPAPTPPPTLKPAGAVHFNVSELATGLVAPWALDFAKDGAIWLTERGGQVRVIRDGRLLPSPALSLSVAGQTGCEDGLLGLAVKEPYAYVYYTYSGGSVGTANRVSRFTIQGNQLAGEQVLLDGIPGGSCYHFGGRLKFGPDGLLYVTTGEGYVASRAANRNNLSGKVLRMHDDGSGQEVFAWGFRNPQGIAFDPAGRLYASNNGPTGEFNLCCHDEVDLVNQGAFYGWPAWAGNVHTGFGGLPDRTPPVLETGTDTWAPSGIAFYAPAADEEPSLYVTALRGQALHRLLIDPADPARLSGQETALGGRGRLRDAVAGPDHCLYVLTSNRDGRGTPQNGDDKLLKLCPA